MSVTPRQLRSSLTARFLSTMPPEERENVMLQLETLAHDSAVDIAPAGAWVGHEKDTLCAFVDGNLLGALAIQKMPFLDPLVIHPNAPWRPLVLEFLRLRAEGYLQASGYDEYRLAVPPELLDYLRYLTKVPGSEETHSGLVVLRRTL